MDRLSFASGRYVGRALEAIFPARMVEQVSPAMTAGPLISAIVPAYNHEQFVGDALRSLMAQTHEHIELIVLDDGSTDATYARIKEVEPELKRRFARVQLGAKCNEGSARTIARCLELASSELVYMLDSDDLAHPEA